ncbi:MAG: class I SAM-dependent methyltransferase [Mycoplasmatales bacterium]
MKTINLNEYVEQQIALYAQPNTTIIDATCGNGYDTFKLATKYPSSRIIGIDVQIQAISITRERCSSLPNVELLMQSHEVLPEYNDVSLIIYNLGYLPNSDKNVQTQAKTTIKSIESGLNKLIQNGAIILSIYQGHDQGVEAKAVLNYLKTINKYQYIVSKYELLNVNNPPIIVVIEKK